MLRSLAFLALAVLSGPNVGCAGARDSAAARRIETRRAERADTASDAPEEPDPTGALTTKRHASSDVLRAHEAALSSETRVIGDAPVKERARPHRQKPIDVNLQRARTAEALQFLADAGGFNLVLQGDLDAPVTVSLHQVDPFDALTAIAESQHLGVEVGRDIVIVGSK